MDARLAQAHLEYHNGADLTKSQDRKVSITV